MTFQITLIIHMMLALALISIILLQHGKGADAGAAFGSGSAGSVFGARGANSFLYKVTFNLALAFFVTSFYLAYLSAPGASDTPTEQSIMDNASELDVPRVSDDLTSIMSQNEEGQ